MAEQFKPLKTAYIDNNAFPLDFIQQRAKRECGRVSCERCGYCKTVADKVMTVNDKPLDEYVSPRMVVPVMGYNNGKSGNI